MAKINKNLVNRFFTGTGLSYDRVVKLFTYGADVYWKKKMLDAMPAGDDILDLACGTGIVTFKISDRKPGCRIVGVDMTFEYLAQARQKSSSRNGTKVNFVCGQAEKVALRKEFDCIISSYIPKYVPAEVLLQNITPCLKKGGALILHDFALPQRAIFRMLWEGHMSLLRLIGPRLFPEWKIVFFELAALVRTTEWLSDYQSQLPAFGYRDITLTRQTAGSSAIIRAIKK